MMDNLPSGTFGSPRCSDHWLKLANAPLDKFFAVLESGNL